MWFILNMRINIISVGKIKERYLKDKQDDLANYLDMKMASVGLEILGKTNPWYSRSSEISDYLNALKMRNIVVNNYVIFDDDTGLYRNSRVAAHLIQTSFINGGLMEKHIKKAATILERSLDAGRYNW